MFILQMLCKYYSAINKLQIGCILPPSESCTPFVLYDSKHVNSEESPAAYEGIRPNNSQERFAALLEISVPLKSTLVTST